MTQAPWLQPLAVKTLFFTGKGGVGKTSLACATALHLADSGKRTLLVSTDPASNLDEALGVELGGEPRAVPGAPGLFALNIDPVAAAERYREKAVAPYRGILPEAAIRSMEEGLSGACTTEIAAFDEFILLLSGGAGAAEFDHVVFDTAPTGHTLRLLSLPAAWTGFLDEKTSGASCLGPLSALSKQRSLYQEAVAALMDGAQTAVILVARPDRASLKEAARASQELAELGAKNQRLILNGVFLDEASGDPLAQAMTERAKEALAGLPPALEALPRSVIPLAPRAMVGLDSLRILLGAEAPEMPEPALPDVEGWDRWEDLVKEVIRQPRGVVMTMGKGGVGKTSLAAALAMRVAEKGLPVTLTTTDPAAHVMDAAAGGPESLRVERIDPAEEVEKYRQETLAKVGRGLDPEGLALLEEDLRSPCTEEIAVFRAFAEAVAQGQERLMVIDTAPTGHTLLLLDAAEAYHREVLRTTTEMPESVRELLPRLRDQEETRVILAALPEPTPVHEAARLQEDLERAGIRPFAWVVNQSLALASPSHPLLKGKAAAEEGPLKEVKALASRAYLLPWQPGSLQGLTQGQEAAAR